MKFRGIKSTGYQKLSSYYQWVKEADRAALPTDYQGMVDAANAYAQQMEQVGLPVQDRFWDYYKDFTYASQLDDINYMKINLESMARRVPTVMQDLEFYTNQKINPSDIPPQKESPDVFTSVKDWSTTGLTFDKLQEGVDQAVQRWEAEVAPRAQDPYSYFWDDWAAFNEAVAFENYSAAKELYDKITHFEDNYPEAQKVQEAEPSEAESIDFNKLMGNKVAIPIRQRSPKRRQDRTLSLLEEILGKPVKNLYDDEGEISDMGEAWDSQDVDFMDKGPSKMIDEPVFDVEIEDEPEVEEEFIPEVKKEVDPFEM